MPGATLFETMTSQVEAEREAHLAEARERASQIRADAEQEAQASREAALKAAAQEKELLDLRLRQKAQAEASKAELAMRNETVEAVMRRVEAEIKSIVEGPNFPKILDALLTSLMDAAGDGEYVVLAPEKHVDHVRQWLESHGHSGVPVEGSPSAWDGVALQDHAKTYRISNTLTGRYRRVGQEARRHCMVSLFGAAEEN